MGETASVAAGADSSAEEALIGVDIANPMKQRLIEQCCFDGSFSSPEEADEVPVGDGEGFAAGASVGLPRRDDGQATEAAGVDETQLASAAEREDGVRMWGDGDVGG